MKVYNHQTLVHIVADLVGGTSVAQNLVAEMEKVGQIAAVSSVYKRYLSNSRVDLNANIEAVVRLATDCEVDELLWHFKQYVLEKKAALNLLSYDDLVVLSPQLTLPHPSLHTDFLIVRCASEAWTQFEHPIIQKTLSEITSMTFPATDAEFLMQGKSLVAF